MLQREFSAGGVVVRRLRGTWHMAAIRPGGKTGVWALPKGNVGPGALNEKGERTPLEVADGDEIIFSKYGGTEIKLGTDDYLILRESDVLAKVVTTSAKKGKKVAAGAAA